MVKRNFKQNWASFSSFILRIYEYKIFYGNSIFDVGIFLQQVIRLRPKSIGPKFPHVSVTQIILNIQGKTLQVLKLNWLFDKTGEILVRYFCPSGYLYCVNLILLSPKIDDV